MPTAAATRKILGTLNEPQREAATHGDEPLLIIAGAGSGKTTTLVHRVAHLIATGVAPNRILLLTFTRRSAADMLRRTQQVLPNNQDSRRVWGGTFHATGARLLRIYGEAIGLNPRFTIHDRGDSEDLMRSLVVQLDLNKHDKKFPKKGTLMAIHSFSVNAGRTLKQVLRSNFFAQIERAEPLKKLFATYERRKRELAVFDYDDLLVRWCELLEHDEVGARIRDRFDYVLVDEYQDTNPLQGRLLELLRPDGRGLSVVGDDAQSIYSFRAATIHSRNCSRNTSGASGSWPCSITTTCSCGGASCWSTTIRARESVTASTTCWSTSTRTPTRCRAGCSGCSARTAAG